MFSLALMCPAVARAGTITIPAGYGDLGTLGGSFSVANGVNADGSVVIGTATTANDATFYAFRWTAAGGLAKIGDPTALSSVANGVSADGSVIVGSADTTGNGNSFAFRWTARGMVDLGTLGGSTSSSNGVSADGQVVVGLADTANDATSHAFRWTASTGMVDLGTLGGSNSFALSADADGSVVVGAALTAGDAANHAFRWTGSSGMIDLGTLGGTSSIAFDVNANGSVVVGSAQTSGDQSVHAFRWTASGGMVDLGTLGGPNSSARGVSADGSVVVGSADLPGGNRYSAFRWTQATGMISVDDWLRQQGVALQGDVAAIAQAVSEDGNIIVGQLHNNHAFIARGATVVATPNGPRQTVAAGLMDLTSYNQSLASVARFTGPTAKADLALNGVNSSPMFALLQSGQSSVYASGDLGRVYSNAFGGSQAVGEVGVSHSPIAGTILRTAVGTTYSKQSLATGGDSRDRGGYVLPEVTQALGHDVYATVTGYAERGNLAERRGYTNGDGLDLSTGTAATRTYGFRARLDWRNAYRFAAIDLSPYASFTRTATDVGRYTETGGAFPAAFDAGTEIVEVARVGSDAVLPLTHGLALVGRAEYAHRFESQDVATTGTILGLSDFSVPGAPIRQDWARGGLGLKLAIGAGEGLAMVNVSNQTVGATSWLNLGYRLVF